MDSALGANNEAASSSNGAETVTSSDQDVKMKKDPSLPYKAAAEGTQVDSQLDIIAAKEGNLEHFNKIARELDSILTPIENTILHISIMSQNRSSKESELTKFVEGILDICPSLLLKVNIKGESPLHVAAKSGDSNMVKILIKRARDLDEELEGGIGAAEMMLRMTNYEENTALHEAVRYEHLDVMKILTEEDPDFTYASNNSGETPLYIAAAKGSSKMVAAILETCTSLAHEGPNQMTALHAAAMQYRPDMTKGILEKMKCLINERDENGWTPLHYAAHHQKNENMKCLLGCDVSAVYIGDTHRKMTPLHIAIGQGYIPHEIIAHCPDCCQLVDERRWNVLHFAVLSLSYYNLKILLRNPLIRNLIYDKDVDGNTPLHLLATFRSHLIWVIRDMVKDKKLDLGVVNNQNLSVLGVKKSGSRQLEQEILKLEEATGPYQRGVVIVKKKKSVDWRKWKRQLDKKEKEEYEKTKESHLIVAALIATVTFTAAFTLPGGVIQDGGNNEGTAILSKKSAFQAFVLTDAIAMVLSLSAVFAHFLMSLKKIVFSTEQSWFLVTYGALSTMIAMVAMVIAFVTGTYAVLTTSLWLAILTTFIGSNFFILMFLTTLITGTFVAWASSFDSVLDSDSDSDSETD